MDVGKEVQSDVIVPKVLEEMEGLDGKTGKVGAENVDKK